MISLEDLEDSYKDVVEGKISEDHPTVILHDIHCSFYLYALFTSIMWNSCLQLLTLQVFLPITCIEDQDINIM